MGWFNFRWEHPADSVFVAGSFNSWDPAATELEKSGTTFERSVDIPETTEKILYKFVVDGVWKHDHTGKTETDHEGNTNNVLFPADIKHGIFQSILSSVAPGASTTAMAGSQPVETSKETMDSTPGTFPVTPAAGLTEKTENQTFSVHPIPASEGAGNPIQLAPGEKVPEPSTVNSNTLTSAVHDDPSLKSQEPEQTFGVAPIPASGGLGNPVTLQPGEKVPDSSTITGNTIGTNVKLDQASYEKADSGAPVLPPVLTPQGEKEAAGEAAIFGGLGPQTTNMIPESSMGMGKDTPAPIDGALDGAAISSVGATSTTNQLAGQVPLEPRGVPEVVADSQKEANAAPEASANPTAVEEKKEVEDELKSKVPEEKATTGSNTGGILGAVAGGIAGVGAAAGAAIAYASKGSDTETKGVPEVVSESQKEAHVAPEASANPVAVEEKKDVENELKAKVPEEKPTSGGGIAGAVMGGVAVAGTAAAGAAIALNSKAKEATGTDAVSMLPESVQKTIHENAKNSDIPAQAAPTTASTVPSATTASIVPATTASSVPVEVTESQKVAHVAPEASANPEAVVEKSATEKELLKKVPTSQATGEPAPTATAATSAIAPTVSATTSGAPQLADPVGGGLAPINMDKELNATADSQAQTPATRVNALTAQADSRDVSPMSKPTTGGQTQPMVTTGIDSAATASQSKPVGTPRNGASNSTPTKRNSIMDRFKGTPESSKTPDSEGKKKGFFSKLKEKLNKH